MVYTKKEMIANNVKLIGELVQKQVDMTQFEDMSDDATSKKFEELSMEIQEAMERIEYYTKRLAIHNVRKEINIWAA